MHVDLSADALIQALPEAVFALSIDPERFPPTFVGFGPVPPLRRRAVARRPEMNDITA